MKLFILGIMFGLVVVTGTYLADPRRKPDEATKRACMQYSLRDHEKEFAPKRWEYLKTIGNPNDVEFWYTSCLNHTRYPVGGAENEWLK